MPASRSTSQAAPLGAFPSAQLPPRRLAWTDSARLLFGGSISQFCWLWIIAGSMFGLFFSRQIDRGAILFNYGEVVGAPGTIVAAAESGSSVNDDSIYAYTYRFSPPGTDEVFTGVSYSIVRFAPGQAVAVDYHADDPARSRIRGMGQAPFGPGNLLIALGPPLAGLLVVSYLLRRGVKASRLLGIGVVTRTTLLSSVKTGTEINEQPIHKLVFGFADQRGVQHTITLRTVKPEIASDDLASSALYNPARPSDAIIIGSLPAEIMVDGHGRIDLGGSIANLAVLALPLLGMVITGILLTSLVR